MSDSNWTSIRDKVGYDAPVRSDEKFEHSQRDKPIKAIIGMTLLVVLALVFSRMGPSSHDDSNTPAATTGQSTGAAR